MSFSHNGSLSLLFQWKWCLLSWNQQVRAEHKPHCKSCTCERKSFPRNTLPALHRYLTLHWINCRSRISAHQPTGLLDYVHTQSSLAHCSLPYSPKMVWPPYFHCCSSTHRNNRCMSVSNLYTCESSLEVWYDRNPKVCFCLPIDLAVPGRN